MPLLTASKLLAVLDPGIPHRWQKCIAATTGAPSCNQSVLCQQVKRCCTLNPAGKKDLLKEHISLMKISESPNCSSILLLKLCFAGALKMHLDVLYHFTNGTHQNSASPPTVSLKQPHKAIKSSNK